METNQYKCNDLTCPDGKVVLLMSGGLDSSTVGAFLKRNEGRHIFPVIVMYGQKHSKEIEISQELAKLMGFEEPVLLDMSGAFTCMRSELLDLTKDVEEDPHRDVVGSTYVPMRNTTLISLATGYAESIGASEVAYGAHLDDSNCYPDCTKEYFIAMRDLVWIATNNQVELRAPFINFRKADIVREAVKSGVPIEKTWSCYNGRDKHCGKCPTCVGRMYAFMEAGIKDPTEYEKA